MKRSERDAWVEALRSGKYQQGRDRLRTNDEYCCLGVLCDLKDPSAWRDLTYYGAYFHGDDLMFPGEQLSGLDHEIESRLSRMNDNGKSFAEIADWIEANIPVEED